MQNLTAEKLNTFFGQLRQPSFTDTLPPFFEALAQALADDKAHIPPPKEPHVVAIDANKLSVFLQSLEQPLLVAKQSGWLCDPWQVAGLKRDEVRNSRVLSWLLNPRGTHGFGDKLLVALLAEIKFPMTVSKNCRVQEEQCPDGDQSNRVDIEIDDANFYLIIEVKIGASEQNFQLLRYAGVSARRAGNRPWGVIYLTAKGKSPTTAGDYMDKVTSISWRRLANILSKTLSENTPTESQARVTALLATSFFRHIRQF